MCINSFEKSTYLSKIRRRSVWSHWWNFCVAHFRFIHEKKNNRNNSKVIFPICRNVSSCIGIPSMIQKVKFPRIYALMRVAVSECKHNGPVNRCRYSQPITARFTFTSHWARASDWSNTQQTIKSRNVKIIWWQTHSLGTCHAIVNGTIWI
jgi:hypothetical protein